MADLGTLRNLPFLDREKAPLNGGVPSDSFHISLHYLQMWIRFPTSAAETGFDHARDIKSSFFFFFGFEFSGKKFERSRYQLIEYGVVTVGEWMIEAEEENPSWRWGECRTGSVAEPPAIPLLVYSLSHVLFCNFSLSLYIFLPNFISSFSYASLLSMRVCLSLVVYYSVYEYAVIVWRFWICEL